MYMFIKYILRWSVCNVYFNEIGATLIIKYIFENEITFV